MTPAADGPLKILFITDQVGMREVVEVCERFDVDRQVLAVWQPDQFAPKMIYQYKHFPGLDEKELEERLTSLLTGRFEYIAKGHAPLAPYPAPHYDLIVIAGINWSTLPESARKEIVARVRAGTGLVASLTQGDDDLLKEAEAKTASATPASRLGAYPFKGLPAYQAFDDATAFADATIQLAEAGKGRIAIIEIDERTARQGLTPRALDAFPDPCTVRYDYYLALLGHVFDWVARRQDDLRVAPPEDAAIRIDRQDLKKIDFTVENLSKNAQRMTARFALRDSREGAVLATAARAVTLPPGTSTVSFSIDRVPAGAYFADLWLSKAKGIAAYGSLFVDVTGASRIAAVALSGTRFKKGAILSQSKDASTRLKVTVTGIMDEGLILDAAQRDSAGRIVARAEPHHFDPDWPEQDVEFVLRPNSVMTAPQHVELTLRQTDDVLDRRRETFFYRDVVTPLDNVRAVIFHGWLKDDKAYPLYTYLQALRQAGFDMIHVHTRNVSSKPDEVDTLWAGRLAALANLDLIVGTSGIGRIDRLVDGKRVQSEYGAVRVPCLTSEAEAPSMKKGALTAAKDWAPFSVKYFDVGDEKKFLKHLGSDDLCFSDTCVADFREWIRTQYPSLDALNAEWDTDFATWDDVVPIDLDAVRKTGDPLPTAGAIARWMDHRAHAETVWARHMTDAGDRIRTMIPFASTGTMGSNDRGHSPKIGALGAVDYWKFVRRSNPNLNYYYPIQLAAARDFAGRGKTLIGGGLWGGYHQLWRAGVDPLHHRWWIWNGLLRGANAITVYRGLGGQSPLSCGAVAQDMSFFDWTDATLEEIERVRRGPGSLLLACERPDDRIAVLYSAPSMNLTTFFPGFPGYWDTIEPIPTIFQAAGFQYRLVSAEQIEQGLLEKDGFNVLYLPQSMALSAEVLTKIKQFAKDGGTVIADLRPAIADKHGKLHQTGALDDLFAVKQTVAEARPAKRSIEFAESPHPRTLPETRVDATLELAGGRALAKAGDAPAVVVNDFGAGKGILLNMALFDYMHPRNQCHWTYADEETDAVASAFFREVLALAGREVEVPITPHTPGCHVTRFRSGEALYLGLLWDAPQFLPIPYRHEPEDYGDVADQTRDVTLNLPEERHVYDVLNGKYIGRLKDVARTVRPGLVQLLAALPYRVESVSVAPVAPSVRQGDAIAFIANVLTDGPEAGMHILHVELIDPDGEVAEVYAHNARAENGALNVSIPLSFNEKCGQWTIAVTDVASGQNAQATFDVTASTR